MNLRVTRVLQRYPRPKLDDVGSAVVDEMRKVPISLPRGSEIAIAVGSRGVANIAIAVKAVVSHLRSQGFAPFIVPAMGSHGGATAEGQRTVIEDYGVTERFVGAPIRSSMEVVELPANGLGHRVFMDKHAFSAAGTVIVNRVKVHTDFHADHESGLLKMTAIGLGKKRQAEEIHSFGVAGLRERIIPTARVIAERGRVLLGIALVENAYDETMIVRAVTPGNLEVEEARLLESSRQNMPSLPVDRLDVLVVDEMGKDVSGAGMDTNVIGRIRIPGQEEPSRPRIGSIVVTDLTSASHGNAVGVGLADVITKRLRDKIDFQTTYENVVTSSFLERGKIPVVADSDRDAVNVALRSCGLGPGGGPPDGVRLIRIRNTLRLNEIYVSDAVLRDIRELERIEVTNDETDLISGAGELFPWHYAET